TGARETTGIARRTARDAPVPFEQETSGNPVAAHPRIGPNRELGVKDTSRPKGSGDRARQEGLIEGGREIGIRRIVDVALGETGGEQNFEIRKRTESEARHDSLSTLSERAGRG